MLVHLEKIEIRGKISGFKSRQSAVCGYRGKFMVP